MTRIEYRTVRELVIEQVRRETELALRLTEQTENRAQVIATTLTLVLSLAAVIVATGTPSVDDLAAPAGVAGGLLLTSLILALFAAFPRSLALTDPVWAAQVTADPRSRRSLETEDEPGVDRLLSKFDKTETELYERVLRSGRTRGRTLLAALIFLVAGLGTSLYVVILALSR